MSSDTTFLDNLTPSATFPESSLDSYEGIVGQRVYFLKRDRVAKSKDQKAIEQLRHREAIRKSLMPEPAPQQTEEPKQHHLKARKSSVPPSREGTVTIAAHASPELKEALNKKFEESPFKTFNDFLIDTLERRVTPPKGELKPSAELAKVLLAQSRELQKTAEAISEDLSSRSR